MTEKLEICVHHEIQLKKEQSGIPIKPEDLHCYYCNGYPVEEGCHHYTTKEHLEEFYRLLVR